VSQASSNPALLRALAVSSQMFEAAEKSEFQNVALLDAERLQLLKCARGTAMAFDASQRMMLEEIAVLNDKSIGSLEYHRRIKGRQMEEAAMGRRAVKAYANIRRLR
jgi:hypothetical protein